MPVALGGRSVAGGVSMNTSGVFGKTSSRYFAMNWLAARWKEHLAARTKLSPLVGVFTSDVGGLNQWMHIWAYKSLDERMAVRKKATAEGIWPPPGDSPALRQETKILLAGPFSPIK